ncbi:MAG: hypothetical protein ABI651_14285, partial [Verrucomicrobiota bacterium]
LTGPGLLASKQFTVTASLAVASKGMLVRSDAGDEPRPMKISGQDSTDVATDGNLSGETRMRPGLAILAQSDGTIQLELNGEPGSHYLVQTSTNLVDWITSFDLVSTQAKSFLRDSRGTNSPRRFYRVISESNPIGSRPGDQEHAYD